MVSWLKDRVEVKINTNRMVRGFISLVLRKKISVYSWLLNTQPINIDRVAKDFGVLPLVVFRINQKLSP